MRLIFANLFIEAGVVGFICSIFLGLMVYAGIRERVNKNKPKGK